jgi:hypothetical protein
MHHPEEPLMMAATVKPRPISLSAARVKLFGLDGSWVADATIVVSSTCDAGMPEIVMFNGDPYLRDVFAYDRDQSQVYRQRHPYRLDIGA